MSYYLKKIKAIKDYLETNIYPPVYNKKKWRFVTSANCYAYSLDIPVSDPKKQIWLPGCLKDENMHGSIYSTSELIKRLYSDLDFLGFSYREDSPTIKNDEYRIEIYTFRSFYDYPIEFHFTRQDSDGVWSEKPSWKGKVCIMDRNPKKMERLNALKVQTLVLKK